VQIHIRLSPERKARWQALASSRGMSLTAFLIESVEGSAVPASTHSELGGEGFDIGSLTTPQLRRYLDLTEERVIEGLREDTLVEKVERVVDVAERFMADPRDVSQAEVTEAKAMLASMRHYDRALAPIRRLHLNWRVPLESDTDIPPAPRF
jgi:hypothetical protein